MSRCPACKLIRRHLHYLCGGCFETLPDPAQHALWRHDRGVVPLLRQLWEQMERDVPLHKIRLAAVQPAAEVTR